MTSQDEDTPHGPLPPVDGDVLAQLRALVQKRTKKQITEKQFRELEAELLLQLAREREERFEARKARILADPDIDPRLAAWYLDRTIWTNTDAADELHVSTQRITDMRGGRPANRRPRPHPAVAPPVDTIEGYIYNVPQPGSEAGAWREWVEKRGSHRVIRETGKLKKVSWRIGRPRAGRPTVGKEHTGSGRRKPTQRRSSENDG